MKKILFAILLLGGLMSSCDMDLKPIGSIDDEDAITSAFDAYRFRTGLYNNIRALSTGPYLYYTEMQMDHFLGTTMNGNRLGNLNNGVILSSDTDIQSIWAGLYGAIADCNYLLPRIEALLNVPEIGLDEALDLKRYIAETHFMRAYYYYWLLDHYCPAYTSANAGQPLGLPITTEYNPTPHKDGYPSRSTLDDTYKFINDELKLAYDGLKEFEESEAVDATEALAPNAAYVSTYAVRAMQARLALLQGKNDDAIAYAKEVIDCGIFQLANRTNYGNMWTKDTSNELIFRPISSKTELGISSTGSAWISADEIKADYIPTYDAWHNLYAVKDLYEPSSDIRWKTFFQERDLLYNGNFTQGVPCFVKFPGNPDLQRTETPNLMNMGKPLRLSEMYLIVAEASQLKGDEETANEYLTTLRTNRILRYSSYATNYTGNELRDQVRLERDRELIGEGFRISDLRRWNQGFSRSGEYPNNTAVESLILPAGTTVVYQNNDYRYTWPIPARELQVNPHMAGQQNPGYN